MRENSPRQNRLKSVCIPSSMMQSMNWKQRWKECLLRNSRRKIVGNIEIRDIFKIPKVGTIAGCMVLDGKVSRTKVRSTRWYRCIFRWAWFIETIQGWCERSFRRLRMRIKRSQLPGSESWWCDRRVRTSCSETNSGLRSLRYLNKRGHRWDGLFVGCWLFYWLLVDGCWLLVVSCWLLVDRCWLLVSGWY